MLSLPRCCTTTSKTFHECVTADGVIRLAVSSEADAISSLICESHSSQLSAELQFTLANWIFPYSHNEMSWVSESEWCTYQRHAGAYYEVINLIDDIKTDWLFWFIAFPVKLENRWIKVNIIYFAHLMEKKKKSPYRKVMEECHYDPYLAAVIVMGAQEVVMQLWRAT